MQNTRIMKRIVLTRNHKRYRIYETANRYVVSIDTSDVVLWDNWKRIGETRTLEDALSLIRSHSGSEIKSID